MYGQKRAEQMRQNMPYLPSCSRELGDEFASSLSMILIEALLFLCIRIA